MNCMATTRYFIRYPETMTPANAFKYLRQIRAELIPQVTFRRSRRYGATVHGELHYLMMVKLVIVSRGFEMYED
jgi:hypothetical protein